MTELKNFLNKILHKIVEEEQKRKGALPLQPQQRTSPLQTSYTYTEKNTYTEKRGKRKKETKKKKNQKFFKNL
jgi:hypothetical protein